MATRVEQVGQALPERRPELDALRMLVVFGLIFFHSALVFATDDDYYVKNSATTPIIMILAGFAVVWAMPVLFLISGLGSWYSLRRRGAAGFVKERLLRLGVPLVFATLVLNPLPQWLRLRSADPGYGESYLAFLPHFYDVHIELAEFPFLLQGEHFETGHLWFVVLLLAFSLMPALLFRVLAADRVRPVADRLAQATFRVRGAILLPALPLALLCALAGMEEDYAGWHRWAYLVFFAAGCALAADDRVRTAMRRAAVPAGRLGGCPVRPGRRPDSRPAPFGAPPCPRLPGRRRAAGLCTAPARRRGRGVLRRGLERPDPRRVRGDRAHLPGPHPVGLRTPGAAHARDAVPSRNAGQYT
ncbi:acyltransferase family protein [Streptomyces avermitilis]|uniref:acyltransferase family protein n=1 Tax=Streptomyces avermitilis TaxID=33903 RepID=UPI0037103369